MGVFLNTRNTYDSSNTVNNLYRNSQADYGSNNSGRILESNNGGNYGPFFHADASTGVMDSGNDEFIISNYSGGTNDRLQIKFSNGSGGDYIRVITRASVPNSPPTVASATDVTGAVTELTDGHADENTATLTDTGSFAIADSDGDTATVSRVLSSTTHSSNLAFGDLTVTIANNTTTDGTGQINWTYSVDDSDLDALDAGESYTETWAIAVSDGTDSETQNVTVTINGAADPVLAAKNDYAWVNEGESVSVADGQTTSGLTGGMTDANSSRTFADFSGGMERFDFNNDGSKLYLNDYSGGNYKQYSLSTPYDVSTATGYTGQSVELDGPNNYYNIIFNGTGSEAFILNYDSDYIRRYSLPTAYDIRGSSHQQDIYVGSYDTTPTDFEFSSDGSKLFLLGSTDDKIIQLNLSTPYNVSTASDGGSFSIADFITNSSLWGMTFSPDGKKVFVADAN